MRGLKACYQQVVRRAISSQGQPTDLDSLRSPFSFLNIQTYKARLTQPGACYTIRETASKDQMSIGKAVAIPQTGFRAGAHVLIERPRARRAIRTC
jgi:hypothetical protein